MTECTICVESYNKTTRAQITCTACDLVCCKECFKRYISDPEHYLRCMSCSTEFDRSSLYTRLGPTFMKIAYKDIREAIIYEQEKSLFPATQELIEHELRLRKLRNKRDGMAGEFERIRQERLIPLKEFRYSMETMPVKDALDKYLELKVNAEAVDEQLHDATNKITAEIEKMQSNEGKTIKRNYVLPCTNANCKGMLSADNVNKYGHYCCAICDTTTCRDCHMGIGTDDHECDPDVLKTVAFMQKTSKPCPACGVPIHKISGCFSAGTIIPLANGTNASVKEIEKYHKVIGDDGTERSVLDTTNGIDQLYMITQSNGCSYEVNTYHTMCLMREDHRIVLMTLNIYIQLSQEQKEKLFGYKIKDGDIILSKIQVSPTKIGRYYGFSLSDNKRFVLQDGTVVHNCSQMFCTSCHASFDWSSGRLNNGAVHNPHHAAWLRDNQNRPRELGDMQCGRELDENIMVQVSGAFEKAIRKEGLSLKDDTATAIDLNYLFESIRVGIHHTHISILSLSRNTHGHHTNQRLRISLLTNTITEAQFKHEIQRRDKAMAKRNELLQIVITYRDALIDTIWGFVVSIQNRRTRTVAEWRGLVNEIRALEKYVNDCFGNVAIAYGSTSPYHIMSDRTIR